MIAATAPKRRGRPPKAPAVALVATHGDKARAVKERRAAAAVEAVRDRRRFKTTPIPTGSAARMAPAGATGTMFPSRLATPAAGDQVLKDGANNAGSGRHCGNCGACWSTDRPIVFVEH